MLFFPSLSTDGWLIVPIIISKHCNPYSYCTYTYYPSAWPFVFWRFALILTEPAAFINCAVMMMIVVMRISHINMDSGYMIDHYIPMILIVVVFDVHARRQIVYKKTSTDHLLQAKRRSTHNNNNNQHQRRTF